MAYPGSFNTAFLFSKFIPHLLLQADVTAVKFALALAFVIPAMAVISDASQVAQGIRL